MKAEVMHAAISKESPVSPGFQFNEDDVQKIEGVMTGGSQGLMKIIPQVENAVKSLKLLTNQMFSGFQKFYRAAPLPQASASDVDSVDAGVLSQTANHPQEFSVQPATHGAHHRGVAGIFTDVGQKIGELLKQPPAVLAQQLGIGSNAVSDMQQGFGQVGTEQSAVIGQSEPVVDTANTVNTAAISTQQNLGDASKVNATDDQVSGVVNALRQQILGDSVKVNASDIRTSGVMNTSGVQNLVGQHLRDGVPKINATIDQVLDSAAPSPLHDYQPIKKGVMPSLASVMQNESVKMITDSLDYVKGKYGGGVVDIMRKLVKNPFLKPQNVIAGSSANQAEDPALPTTGLLANDSAGPAEVSSLVGAIAPVKQSIAAAHFAKGTQGLDSLAQRLLVHLQPGVNSLNQLVNQWPVGDSNQAMEHVGAISKSLQIEPNAILNLSNPGVVAGLMGELTVPDTRRYPYARDASLTFAQPAAASNNLNQTTTINVYGAAEPQVTANEIEARQTNIHSRLSQQLSGGPR